jgi:hypothetical protein
MEDKIKLVGKNVVPNSSNTLLELNEAYNISLEAAKSTVGEIIRVNKQRVEGTDSLIVHVVWLSLDKDNPAIYVLDDSEFADSMNAAFKVKLFEITEPDWE